MLSALGAVAGFAAELDVPRVSQAACLVDRLATPLSSKSRSGPQEGRPVAELLDGSRTRLSVARTASLRACGQPPAALAGTATITGVGDHHRRRLHRLSALDRDRAERDRAAPGARVRIRPLLLTYMEIGHANDKSRWETCFEPPAAA